MYIAVCDDNISDRTHLEQLTNALLTQRRIDGYVCSFKSGEELLAAAQSNRFAVCLLDIYMVGKTGVQVAYALRESHPDICIIFTTSSPDHMAEGFDIGAVHYILKPVTGEALEKAFDRVLQFTCEAERYITLHIDRTPHNILLSEIICVESRDKTCIITTGRATLHVYIRLDVLEGMLGDIRFLRCHRSYLINMDYAAGVAENGFKMSGGIIIPIKRDKRQEMKKRFSEYCFEKLRREMR